MKHNKQGKETGKVRKPLGKFHKKNDKNKADEKPKSNSNKPIESTTKPEAKKKDVKVKDESKNSVDVLLREIINLGGTKDDYEFLKQDSSDEEELLNGDEDNLVSEGGVSKDKKTKRKLETEDDDLGKELSKLINSLGIKKMQLDDPEQESLELELKQIIKEGGQGDENYPGANLNQEQKAETNVKKEEDKELDLEFKDSSVLAQGIDRIFSKSSIKPNQQLFKKLQRPVIPTNTIWYDVILPELDEGPSINQEYCSELYEQAKSLIAQEDELIDSKTGKSSDKSFMKDIMQGGTLSDKISALTLQIQEDPIHRIKELAKLMSMMRKNNRREALLCLASFKDLCLNNLIPDDRKLKFFEDQNISAPNLTQKHLIVWYFEDYLKKAFFDYLIVSEAMSHDSVVHAKQSTLTSFYELLLAKPEQESNILTLFVNKLGDKENKIASSASYLLLQTLEQHPSMKGPVIESIEKLVVRSNISLRAQYYSIITLNQMVLGKNDKEIATKLVDLYFTLFEEYLTKPTAVPTAKVDKKKRHRDKAKDKNKVQPATTLEELEADKAKAVAGLLTGVNRAFHYADIDLEKLNKHINMLFSVAYKFTFNTAIQALSLLHHILKLQPHIHNRYMKVLYATLFDPRLIHSSKQALYLNLLYKSLKDEQSSGLVMAFVKRMVQASALHQPPFVTGLFFVVSKLAANHPVINASIIQPEDTEANADKANAASQIKEEEVDDELEEIDEEVKEAEEISSVANSLQYQPRDDNPEKSYAEYTCLWELLPLIHHYHPNIQLQSNKLLNLESIQEQSQLHLHTLQHFLDRFAYRNPKKSSNNETKGLSIMQPLLSHYSKPGYEDNLVWVKGAGISNLESINSKAMLKKDSKNLQADQLFFQKYFQLSSAKSKKNKNKHIEDDADNNDDDASTDEEAMWKEITGKTKLDDLDLDDPEDDEAVDFEDLDYTTDDEEDEANNEDGSEGDEVKGDEKLADSAKALAFEDMMDLEQDDDLPTLPKKSKSKKEVAQESDEDDLSDDEELDEDMDSDIDDDDSDEDNDIDEDDDEDESGDDIDFNFDSSDDDTPKSKGKANLKRKPKYDSDDSDSEEDIKSKKGKGRKPNKKRSAKDLPTFASADDYADMLSD